EAAAQLEARLEHVQVVVVVFDVEHFGHVADSVLLTAALITSSCVDGPRLARENVACRTEVACSHVSGLFTQSGGTAGPDGVREPRPHHSSGIDVPMKRQASLGCVGSTDCAITRHCSLASSSLSAVGD